MIVDVKTGKGVSSLVQVKRSSPLKAWKSASRAELTATKGPLAPTTELCGTAGNELLAGAAIHPRRDV